MAELNLAELHPWARSVVEMRAGGPVPNEIGGAGLGLTANQGAGEAARKMVAVQYAHLIPGHPLANERAAEAAAHHLIGNLSRDRMEGMFLGEALGTYGAQHFGARAISLTATLALRSRYPGNAPLLLAHRHLIGWWRASVDLCLELRGSLGVVLDPWCRRKFESVLEPGTYGGPRACETVTEGFAPMVTAHPDLLKRWREPGDSQWWIEHRPAEWLLRRELEGIAGLHLSRQSVTQSGRIGRLADRTYWRWENGRLHVLCPELRAKPDSDGRTSTRSDIPIWDRQAKTYGIDPGPRRVQKGVSACWELRETDGRLELVYLRGIQGARGGDLLPHPEGHTPEGEGWLSAGPDSEPYPLPEPGELDGGAVRPPEPPSPPPEGTEPAKPEPPKLDPGQPTPDIPGARKDIKAAHQKLGSAAETKAARKLLYKALQEIKGA